MGRDVKLDAKTLYSVHALISHIVEAIYQLLCSMYILQSSYCLLTIICGASRRLADSTQTQLCDCPGHQGGPYTCPSAKHCESAPTEEIPSLPG